MPPPTILIIDKDWAQMCAAEAPESFRSAVMITPAIFDVLVNRIISGAFQYGHADPACLVTLGLIAEMSRRSLRVLEQDAEASGHSENFRTEVLEPLNEALEWFAEKMPMAGKSSGFEKPTQEVPSIDEIKRWGGEG